MNLKFCGAAGEVTGSRHLLRTSAGTRVLLDCGLFQGHRNDAIRKNKDMLFDPGELDGVLVSHAHIDHTGGLPILVKKGLKCPIHATQATQELCSIMLMDSAHIQEEDAKFFNKVHAKNSQRIDPLYTEDDALRALRLFAPHAYDERVPVAPDLSVSFLNAGHVLGSAMLQIDAGTGPGARRVLFTGDLGRRNAILMRPPAVPKNVDYLIIESTYGGRVHESIDQVEVRLADLVSRISRSKGKLLVPSFALERTQEIIFILEKLLRKGKIPEIPIYVDSPMTVNISEIFSKHAKSFAITEEFKPYVSSADDPFGFKTVRYVRTTEESKKLNDLPGPLVVVSSSGMCEGGRILHHLRNNVGDDNAIILLVGYQAEGTLGHRLQNGAKKVKIFGLEHEVWARVESIHSLSAHADENDLLWFMRALQPRPRRIFLVHGDPRERAALAGKLKSEGFDRVEAPEYGDSRDLD